MSSSKKNNRNRGKRPTATIDLKAKEVSTEASKSSTTDKSADAGAKSAVSSAKNPAASPSQSSQGEPAKTADTKTATAKPVETSKPAGKPDETSSAKSAKPKADAEKPSAANPNSSSRKAAPARSSAGSHGAMTHLVAGGLGGLIALFGVHMFEGAPVSGQDADKEAPALTEALETRLSALETSVKSSIAAGSADVTIPSELMERINKLEGLNETLAGLAETQNKLTGATTELNTKVAELSDPSGGGAVELRSRLDAMEGTIASLGKAAEGANGQSIPQLAALAGRINDLQTQLEARVAAVRKATKDDLESRFVAIESTIKTSADGSKAVDESIATLTSGGKRVSLAVETARADLERLSNDITGVKKTVGDAAARLAKTEEAVTGLETQLKESQSSTTESLAARPSVQDVTNLISPVEKKLAAVEEKVTSVLSREESRTNSAKQIVLALELANLRRAIDRGQDVSGEVARIKKSAPASVDLTPLDKLVTSDVPSRAELVSEFRGVSRKVLQAESRVEGASTFEQLLANARSIVRVRKTGDVEGDMTDAIISRTEDDLQRSDIKSALGELSKLKGVAAEAASSWMAKARDRLAIDATLEMIEAGLKTSVSGATTN